MALIIHGIDISRYLSKPSGEGGVSFKLFFTVYIEFFFLPNEQRY